MTPTQPTPTAAAPKQSRWKAALKAIAFAAAAVQGLSATIADPTHPASVGAIGTTAGVSAAIGALGYLLRSPLPQEAE